MWPDLISQGHAMPLEELRQDRVLEPLCSASVSLGRCCAGQSPLSAVDEDDVVDMTASTPFLPPSLSVLPEKARIATCNGGLPQTRPWPKKKREAERVSRPSRHKKVAGLLDSFVMRGAISLAALWLW